VTDDDRSSMRILAVVFAGFLVGVAFLLYIIATDLQ